MPTIEFRPDLKRLDVKSGTTVLDAARHASVSIDTMCGGEGTCGKCRVRLVAGKIDSGPVDLLTPEEVGRGLILACQARITCDVVVEIPPESRVRAEAIEFRAAEAGETAAGPLDPVVRKLFLEVPVPTLEYNRADADRLVHALRDAGEKEDELAIGLDVVRGLPRALRDGGHRVTASISWRGPSRREVTEVVAGDSSGRNLAVAVDVGTTTVVADLLDLSRGKVLGTAGKYNSQAVYGADVIRRILWSTDQPGGLRQLHACITGDINALIAELCRKLNVRVEEIGSVVAAGNTTMTHLLLEVNPEWVRREPYIGVVYRPGPVRAREVGVGIAANGLLHCLPCVSAYVGGDITAGVLALGLADAPAPEMLIDMGTNGEVVVGCRDFMVCASASAGPAFEGAGTRHGMRAMAGAVDHFTGWAGGGAGFAYTTVGGGPPAGLCGTAYVDLLVQLLRGGAVDKTGRFNAAGTGKRLRTGPDSLPEFLVIAAGENGAEHDMVITQADLDNLLRAKGAIYATTKILLKSLGITARDLGRIAVAGSFGTHLNARNAVAIGLLPDEPPEKIAFAGNTSLRGAEAATRNVGDCARTAQLADAMTYYELSTDPSFMEEFTSACFLPHTNVEEFPSVPGYLKGGGEK